MTKQLLRVSERFELVIVSVLLVLLMVILLIGTLDLIYVFALNISTRLRESTDAAGVQQNLHMAFGGFLVILLGIELMSTIRMYLIEHQIHVETVFLVAMIAVGRHVIELDYAHASVGLLLGISGILLALSGGYFLLKKSGISAAAVPASEHRNR